MHVLRQINQLYAADVDKIDIGFLFTGKGNKINKYESLYYGRLLHNNKINTDDDEDYTHKAITVGILGWFMQRFDLTRKILQPL